MIARMPVPLFARLPRGLKLVMIGMVLWLIATAPLMAYLLLARLLEQQVFCILRRRERCCMIRLLPEWWSNPPAMARCAW